MHFIFTRLLVFIVLIQTAFSSAISQSSVNYTTSVNQASSLSKDKNGNVIDFAGKVNLIPVNDTYSTSAILPVGFDFIFMGKLYKYFIAGNDGQIGLAVGFSAENHILAGYDPNSLIRNVIYPPSYSPAPVIAAFWDDLGTAKTGSTVQYVVTGVAPFRCMAVQWNALINSSSSTATNPADGVFQLRLYEGTGNIEFVYGKMSIGAGSSVVTASVGFTSGNTDNSFIALKDLTSFNFTRLVSEENATRSLVNSSTAGPIQQLNSTSADSCRSIFFSPVITHGNFTSSGITDVFSTTMTLHWTDTISNKYGYLIYRSASDTTHFALDTALPTSVNNYIANGLLPNTRYFWKIIPFTEGNTATYALITDSTRCSMKGTYTIGPGGNFLTMQSAQDSLAKWGLEGPAAWQLLSGFDFKSQVLPITFRSFAACQDKNNQITIQPAAGAAFNFVNNSASPVFLLDSTTNIIIDGRANSTGPSAISFEGGGQLLKFKNAWRNEIKFIDFRSNANTVGNTAVVFEALGGKGNFENSIRNCSFHDRGGSFSLPFKLITATTSETSTNKKNIISTSNFYNFKSFAIDLFGEGWNIDSNSFYATIPIDAADTSGFINLDGKDTTTNTVTNNYFGGSAPFSNGTILSWNSKMSFSGINVFYNTTVANNNFKKLKIQSNTPYNSRTSTIDLVRTGKALGSTFYPYFNVRSNTFGGSNSGDSISLISNTTNYAAATAIYHTGPGTTTIKANSFSNIHTVMLSNPQFTLNLIDMEGSSAVIDSNILGVPDSNRQIEHWADGAMAGIFTYGTAYITNNTITNIAAKTKMSGILANSSFGSITGNTISYNKSLEGSDGSSYYSVGGIAAFGGRQTISKNRILHLQDLSTANAQSGLIAILCKETNNTIDANLIDGLIQNPLSKNQKGMTALAMYDNADLVTNNMVRLGVDSAGNAVRGKFNAYSEGDYTTNNRVIHNTFYITGADTTGPYPSSCVFWLAYTPFVNNIMVNNRHSKENNDNIYLVASDAKSSYKDYNIYQTANGKMSYTENFQQWQVNGKDPNSIVMSPNFVKAEGPSRLLDLHVTGQTPAEGRGTAFGNYTITLDYDGESRNANTPVDIGADAGKYIPVDLVAPVISVTPLPDATDTTSRFIKIRIQDNLSGLKDTGNTRPAIWFRKSYPDTTSWTYTFGSLDSGTVKNGIWKFKINHQLLQLNPQGGDSVKYYFVAQDTAVFPKFNLTISPSEGGSHASVTQQLAAPMNPYKYRINIGGYIIPPIVNVGINQHYTSLTRDGGVFEGIAKDSIQGDLVIRVTSYLSETGKWALDSIVNRKNIRVTIVPAIDSVFIIKNQTDLSTDMLRFYNADNVTIDGSFNSAGRWLQLINTHTNAVNTKATIALYNGSDNFVLKNVELKNNTSSVQEQAIVTFSDGTFMNPVFRNNLFTNVAGLHKPSVGILAFRTGHPIGLAASGNEFVNLDNGGLHFTDFCDKMRIDSNHFYWSDTARPVSNYYVGIDIIGTISSNSLTGNYFGGSEKFAGGNVWVNNAVVNNFSCIKMGSRSTIYSVIEGNVIKNIQLTNSSSGNFMPIISFGTTIINGNTIGDSTNFNSLRSAVSSNTMIDASGISAAVSNNLISGIICTNSTDYTASFTGIRTSADSSNIIHKNIIRNITSASSSYYSSNNALAGISATGIAAKNRVEENEVFNLQVTDTGRVTVAGIEASTGASLIRNRIYNNTAPNSNSGLLTGVQLMGFGEMKVENNQVTLSNGASAKPVNIYGIADYSIYGTNMAKSITYNTMLLKGQQSGTGRSFGYYTNGPGITRFFKNNLVINVRSGGTAQQGGIAVDKANPAGLWLPATSNFNLFVVNDTSAVHKWGTGNMLSMRRWKDSTGGDHDSYITDKSILNADSLFIDPAHGNLNINRNNSICWYVNGKGIPVNDIDADYNSLAVRSTNISNGPTDIGSNEFTTFTSPPPLYVYGNHTLGGSDTLSFNGRIAGIINWGNTGALPAIESARLYSGVWPNDTTNNGTVSNAHYMSGFVSIPATGGTNYSYSLSIFYDSSMLGKVTDENTMVINKRQSNVAGSWQVINPTLVNRANHSVTINNQTSFSEFTATDRSFALPVHLISFTGIVMDKDVKLKWIVSKETEGDYYEVERSFDAINFEKIRTIAYTINNAGSYSLADAGIVKEGRVICYRLKLVDKTGASSYSNTIKFGLSNLTISYVINVEPAIFNNGFYVNLNLKKDDKVQIRLVDVEGRIRYNHGFSCQKGILKLAVNDFSLRTGLYVLQIIGSDWSDKQWVLKQ